MAEDIKLVIGTDNPTVVVTTTDKVDIKNAAKSSDINFVATGSSGIKGDTGPQGPAGTGITTEQAAAIEANTSKNSFDGASINKLNNIEANAQVNRALLDEDNMASDSDTLAPTQQSVKAYVDGQTHLQIGTNSTNALAGNTTTISTEQASAITANTAKTGITASQASAITANTAKTGITTSQANAITANTAKPDLTVENAGTVHPSNYTDTNTQLTQEQVEDYAGDLIENGTKTGITVTYDDNSDAINMVVDHDAATNFVAEEHYRWDNDIQSTATINHLNLSSDTPGETEVLVMNDGDAVWGHGEKIHIQVRNDEGSTIPAGQPLYSKGEIGGSNRILVGVCDANDSAKMPCIGIAHSEMNTTSTKDNFAVVSGIYNTTISGFTSLAVGDNLYIQDDGSLSQTKPTGETSLIQNVAIVLRTNGSICQGMLVSAIGRTNDVPNLNSGYVFYGNGSNQAVSTQLSTLLSPDLTVDGAGTVHPNNYTDTVYTHPSNHAISVITGLQTALNSKQDAIGSEDLTIQQTDGLQDALDAKVDDSQVLTNVPANAVFTDTVYTHPANHAISVITGLQTALNSKQDGIGSEDLTIAMTDGLQDALNAKVDDSQVLTNVPANAVFTDTNTTYSIQDGELSQNNFTDADHTKLNGIEASADVTDAANVTAAGALMDSELTDLAGVKGVTISTLQVKPSEGAFANGDKTKLDSIAANATADQTNVTGSSGTVTSIGNLTGEVVSTNRATTIAKQKEIYFNNFDDKIGTTQLYIPFKSANEQTLPFAEEAAFLTPTDGRVVSVTVRGHVITGSGEVTVSVRTFGLNASVSSSFTIEESKAHDINTADDHHAFHFVFDNAKHFESGELVAIGIKSDTNIDGFPATSYWYATTVVEYDWANQGFTAHQEYDSAQ